MTLGLRILLTILTAVVATAAALGFGISLTLTDQGVADFATAMQSAIQEPPIQQEIQEELRAGISTAGEELASRAGPLAGLARSGTEQLADQAVATVPTQRFATAWQEWVSVLSTGLAAAAEGVPDSSVQVNGADVVVEIAPLLAPITGESVAGGVANLLTNLGRDTTITVTTGIDLEGMLALAGRLAQWAWLLAVAAIALTVVVVALGRHRWRWLGIVALAAALGCAAAAAVLVQVSARPSDQMPELSRAVMTALTAPWVDTAVRTAIALTVGGLIALVVGLVLGTRRSTEPKAT